MTELTLDDLKDLNLEELQELVLENQTEYLNLKSSTTKGAQQLIEEKKLLEKAVSSVIKDETQLEDLKQTDPELAQKLAKKLFNKDAEDLTKKETKDVSVIVEQEIMKRDVQQKVDKIVKQLPTEAQEKFMTEYAELTEGKKITTDNVEKFIKLSISSINEGSENDVDYIRAISLGASSGGTKTKSSKQSSDEARRAYALQLIS